MGCTQVYRMGKERFAYNSRNDKSNAMIKTKHSDTQSKFIYKFTPIHMHSIYTQRETVLFAFSSVLFHKNTLF